MKYRIEKDSFGEIQVPSDKYWGAQTQRSLECFDIGKEKFDSFFIECLSLIKLSCALANNQLCPERLTDEKLKYITLAYEQILKGKLDGNFPLSVWQTGSGTQTNMNVNEVFANYGNELAGKRLLHPNDDVNMSQSSNDVFPSAMHVCTVLDIKSSLIPEIKRLINEFLILEERYKNTTNGFMYDDAASLAWTEDKKLLLYVQIIDRYFGNMSAVFAFKGDDVAARFSKNAEHFLDEYKGTLIAHKA